MSGTTLVKSTQILAVLCALIGTSLASAGVTIQPGQTISAGGIEVSCSSRGGPPVVEPQPPREKPTIEVFYCARKSQNFVLRKNRYQVDGTLVAGGIDVFQADSKVDCYNTLKSKRPAIPRFAMPPQVVCLRM